MTNGETVVGIACLTLILIGCYWIHPGLGLVVTGMLIAEMVL